MKIGVTVVAKPVAHGAGIYLRIPHQVVEAYDLLSAVVVETTIDRAKFQPEFPATESPHVISSPEVTDRKPVHGAQGPDVEPPSPRGSSEVRRRRKRSATDQEEA